jgi:DNA adenine methylase
VRSASPLRYPGGKWRFSRYFTKFLASNFEVPPLYIEPYAGGASLALSLLFEHHVSEIWLNDLDPAIHACWHSIVNEGGRFCEMLQKVPITLEERQRQKLIYSRGLKSGRFALGFSTFFLNRTNHSGILNGGVIGGQNQVGTWKIDARFNRDELIRRVERIAVSRRNIKLTCLDAGSLLRSLKAPQNCLVYLDPPYVGAGKALYMNAYKEADHAVVRDRVCSLKRKWIVSYDDVSLIRSLYKGYRSRRVELLHTAREAKIGNEILFFSNDCIVPRLA